MSDQLKVLNTYLAQGKIIEFNESLNQLKNLNQINDEIYYKYLGFFHLQKNNLTLAEQNLIKSLNYNNDSFDNHLNLGVCYLKQNKKELALEHFEKSLKIKNNFLDTYILYSRALRNFDLNNKAVEILNTGLKKVKNKLKIYAELAEIYREGREFLLAILNYNFLIKSNPTNYIVLNSIAVCYETLGEIEMAESNYLKAIKIKPDYFEAIANLGNLKRAKGENTEALNLFKKCLKLKHPKSKIYRYISIFHKFKSDQDNFLLEMLNYLESEKLNKKDPDIEELYFALVKAYDDLKDIQKFGYYLNIANKEKRKKISDIKFKKEVEFFSVIKSIFSKEFSNSQLPEISGDKVILVLGMPRSGTTLVEQILNSHNKVVAGGEQVFFQNILRKYFDFYDHKKFNDNVKSQLNQYRNQIATQYLNKLKEIDKSKIVTDKLPFNFFYIGFFLSVFKNIKIIHINRDSMDNCFSIYKNFFPEQINFAYNQDELSNYYLNYSELMKHWKNIYSEKIYDIQYENLILNTESEVKKLLNFCELEWDQNCLKFYESKNAVNTLSSSQVRNPIYSSSVKSWKKYESFLKVMEKKLN